MSTSPGSGRPRTPGEPGLDPLVADDRDVTAVQRQQREHVEQPDEDVQRAMISRTSADLVLPGVVCGERTGPVALAAADDAADLAAGRARPVLAEQLGNRAGDARDDVPDRADQPPARGWRRTRPRAPDSGCGPEMPAPIPRKTGRLPIATGERRRVAFGAPPCRSITTPTRLARLHRLDRRGQLVPVAHGPSVEGEDLVPGTQPGRLCRGGVVPPVCRFRWSAAAWEMGTTGRDAPGPVWCRRRRRGCRPPSPGR